LISDINIEPLVTFGGKDSGTQIAIMDNNGYFFTPSTYDLTDKQIQFIMSKISANNRSFILDSDPNNNSNYIVVIEKSNVSGLYIIGFRSLEEVEAIQWIIIVFVCILIFVSIMVTIIISFLISKSILNPINKLVGQFKQIALGNVDVAIEPSRILEVDILSKTSDYMIKSIIKLNQAIVEESKKTAEVQLKALQHQINPHFLNNVLQSIKALAVCGDVDAISSITVLLGKVLAYSVYNPYELVTLDDEIRYVENYMKIQNIRYHNMFSYEIINNDNLGDLKLPKLILQPIIENSIDHGISPKREGHISLEVFKKHDKVFIRIEDDGIGICESDLAKIVENTESDNNFSQESSIGLTNVNQRIKNIYNEKCQMTISSVYGLKTVVEISVIIC